MIQRTENVPTAPEPWKTLVHIVRVEHWACWRGSVDRGVIEACFYTPFGGRLDLLRRVRMTTAIMMMMTIKAHTTIATTIPATFAARKQNVTLRYMLCTAGRCSSHLRPQVRLLQLSPTGWYMFTYTYKVFE